jgi:hypothetical protein
MRGSSSMSLDQIRMEGWRALTERLGPRGARTPSPLPDLKVRKSETRVRGEGRVRGRSKGEG